MQGNDQKQSLVEPQLINNWELLCLLVRAVLWGRTEVYAEMLDVLQAGMQSLSFQATVPGSERRSRKTSTWQSETPSSISSRWLHTKKWSIFQCSHEKPSSSLVSFLLDFSVCLLHVDLDTVAYLALRPLRPWPPGAQNKLEFNQLLKKKKMNCLQYYEWYP